MKNTFCLLLLFSVIIVQSQTIIKGKITDKNNQVIENASITIENIKDDSVIAFCITDEKGNYSIEIEESNSKLRVVVTTVSYKRVAQEISFKSQTLNFTLFEEVNQLEEVKIDIKAIQQKGDTLTYDVKSFEGKEDRTLSDVLKKIPGIEVGPTGRIKYQGVDINKFYVEGKDLMAGGYGTLTNSLPKDAVSKLQVLENHQPIKSLKDKISSNRAAINIKLKKDVTLTGMADVGSGFSPILWNAKITPMVFTKKYQYLLNYKSNNIGENITYELQTFSFDEGFEGLTSDNQTGTWLNVFETQLPKINENRYLFNKTHLFSANLLTSLSKDWEFKSNISYINNNSLRQDGEFTKVDFYDSSGNIQNSTTFNRINSSKINNNQIKSQLIFTKNSEKSFFKNTLTYKTNWDNVLGYSLLNSSDINQRLTSPGFSFQNSLSAILLVGKKVLNIKSTLNYINDGQTYTIAPYANITLAELPSNGSEKAIQNLVNKTLNISNEVSFIFSFKKFSVIPSLSLEVEKKKLNTILFGENNIGNTIDFGENFKNNLFWNKFVPISSFAINYINESLSLNFNLPYKLNLIHVEDNNIDFSKKLNRFTFEPNFNAKYKFTSELSKTLYGSISNEFGALNSIYPSYIFSGLNLSRQNSDIQQSSIKKIGGNFEYKLILYNLFINLNYEVNQIISNNTMSQNVSGNGQTVIEQVLTENKTNGRNINFEISKYIPVAKSKISLGCSVNARETNTILNSINRTISSKGNSLNFKMNNNFFSWMTLDYTIMYSTNTIDVSNKTSTLTSNINTLFFPLENHSIGINREDYVYNFNNQKFKNQFLDLSYQYTLEKRKIDFELKWTNILNTKNYQEIVLNNFGYTSNTFTIRPSQVLAGVKFYFN